MFYQSLVCVAIVYALTFFGIIFTEPFTWKLSYRCSETTDDIKIPMFWVVATSSGLLGLAISFTSMWSYIRLDLQYVVWWDH